MLEEEVLLDFPRPLEPTTAVRSTLLTSSLASLRELGLFERYDRLQRSPHRDTILSSVAGEWLDMDVAFAHYAPATRSGSRVTSRSPWARPCRSAFTRRFCARSCRQRAAGLTPWVLLKRGDSLQARLNRGGGVRLVRMAERIARVEIAKNPLLEVPYFRNAFIGMYTAGVELLGADVTVRLLHAESQRPSELTALRVEWAEPP